MSYLRRVKPLAHRPQQVVGGYRLERVAGYGRYSVVYVAHARDGARVALKLARSGHLAAEFEAAQSCAHDGVVRVFGHGVEGGLGYLVMEHATAGALPAPRAPLDEAEIAQRLVAVASALAHVHRSGYVHRDLKPANLVARADGTLLLTDFGCACRSGACPPADGGVIGSPRYAAPEQNQGAPASAAADVYSLGVLLYEWLRGEPPFPGDSAPEQLAQHQVAQVPDLPQAQAGWQPLLRRMLAKDAGARLANGAAVLAAIREAR